MCCCKFPPVLLLAVSTRPHRFSLKHVTGFLPETTTDCQVRRRVEIKGDTVQSRSLECERRKCQFRVFIVVVCSAFVSRSVSMHQLWICAHRGSAMLIHSLPMKNRKGLTHDVMCVLYVDAHVGLGQNDRSAHICVFTTFKRHFFFFLSFFGELEYKSTESLPWVYFGCFVYWHPL